MRRITLACMEALDDLRERMDDVVGGINLGLFRLA